jgi:hypothetical protein
MTRKFFDIAMVALVLSLVTALEWVCIEEGIWWVPPLTFSGLPAALLISAAYHHGR